jgi:hypothetical protein
MENMSLGRGEARRTPNEVRDASVRCPSCDHANPAGSHFCNQCGMPVHFEACGRCEAINLRGAPSCHKCGCILPGSAIPKSAAPIIVERLSSQAADPIDSTTDLPPVTAEPVPRRRSAGIRAAWMTLGVALVAVPTYIATEHPASFDRIVDAIALPGRTPSDSTSPTSGPAQPVVQPSQTIDARPAPAAETREAAPPAPQLAGAPPSETVRESRRPDAAASTAVAPPIAKSARASTTKSQGSRSKQGTPPRKASTRKPAPKSS